MYCENNCYFCKYLCFFDVENAHEFVCTLTGMPYQKAIHNMDCKDYIPDMEE